MTYIIDFAKNLFKKSNIGIIVFLILNTIIVAAIFSSAFEGFGGAILGIVVYIISLAIALSPIGEWILRIQTGSKKIKRKDHLDRLEPLFQEVLTKARQLNPSIPENVGLFMSNDKEPNAFATGRKTVCLTRGLLNHSDEEIKAVFAHELGHLANKDTDLVLLVAIGNFIVTAAFILFRIFFNIIGILTAIISDSLGTLITTILIDGVLVFSMWVWTKIGIALVMHSSRQNEYLADEFAYNCGYGNSLCSVLDTFYGGNSKGLWANLASSHPDTNDRIARLQELGCNYTA
ncbi:heat shock protein HtpX [Keratinibaculum paraultunense]|uniref:Heat shock protein HtpX n=1 Tax=Keratinibaculum paraultunense TaxID=1278232 RepID=A0A4R3L0S5_9FIRM|nr:zinc metalloprotease HtpX [Keratinibaculum paraultunense]QQY80072.1 M48 family metalloprotease [Keratinibaculum paraultunense]TCS91608.1 heat shock protein HtpX [Keratinibaculum paraultunense]